MWRGGTAARACRHARVRRPSVRAHGATSHAKGRIPPPDLPNGRSPPHAVRARKLNPESWLLTPRERRHGSTRQHDSRLPRRGADTGHDTPPRTIARTILSFDEDVSCESEDLCGGFPPAACLKPRLLAHGREKRLNAKPLLGRHLRQKNRMCPPPAH